MLRELFRRLLTQLRRHSRPDKIMYIGGSDTLPPPLPRDEEAALLARLDQGELPVRQTLIERNLRLVVYIARRFENTGINIEDLISIGTIGLIKAINTFRTDKNIKLATYASRCIENEILMYLRKNNGSRVEVSFDEPLNTDWDGKELLLSDVLGTDSDVVMRPIEDDVDRQMLADAVASADEEPHPLTFDRTARRAVRPRGEIGISSVRGGSIVGEHEVIFAGKDEVLTLTHTATSREVFATGALRAAAFLAGKPAGLYDMNNLLG